jgi:hypothetical protein
LQFKFFSPLSRFENEKIFHTRGFQAKNFFRGLGIRAKCRSRLGRPHQAPPSAGKVWRSALKSDENILKFAEKEARKNRVKKYFSATLHKQQ